MKKDTTLKPIIKKLIKPLSKYFFKKEIDTDNITFIDKELQRVEKREADIVANIDNQYILHIEIQNSYEKNMPQRMLRYYLDIQEATENSLPIYQYCIYVGKDRNYLKDKIVQNSLNYQYTLIDTREIDCEYLLNESSPEAKVLAILCDFKQKEPREVVKYILDELQRLVKNEREFRNFLMILEILSTNRDLQECVKEEGMLRTMTYEDLPSYNIGFEKGIEKGIKKGIEKGIKKGKIEGQMEEKRAIARSLLDILDDKTISERVGLDIKEVKKIREKERGE